MENAKTIGVDVKFLKPEQVKEIWPFHVIQKDSLGRFNTQKMDIFSLQILTQAMATGARNHGAEIYRTLQRFWESNKQEGWMDS